MSDRPHPVQPAVDRELRAAIYRHLAERGRVPARSALSARFGGDAVLDRSLRRLHEAHAIVLDDDGWLRMALPFSAIPTEHVVKADNGKMWWANCAWDALAIPAALDIDADIEANWLDDEEPVELRIAGGELRGAEGFVHFTIPAKHWWDDIVET